MSIENGSSLIILHDNMRIAALTSNDLNMDRALRDVSNKDVPGWKQQEYGQASWGGSADGLVFEETKNLATRSEDFADAAWVKTYCTATRNTDAAPNGTLTGNTIGSFSFADTLLQVLNYAIYNNAARTYTFSVWLRGTAGQLVDITIFDDTATQTLSVTLTASWQRYSVTYTSSGDNSDVQFGFVFNTASTFKCWGAQVEEASAATNYVPSGHKWDTLRTALINKTKLTVIFTDQLSGHRQYAGTAVIESLAESAPLDDNRTFSCTLSGDGVLTPTTI